MHRYGWYGAAVLNKAAMLKYAAYSRDYPLTQMCRRWGCSQDIGFGLLAWMLQFNHIAIPGGIDQIQLEDRAGKDLPGKIKYHEYYLSKPLIVLYITSILYMKVSLPVMKTLYKSTFHSMLPHSWDAMIQIVLHPLIEKV
jgi:hypothetical protein